jgi:hypothetical protein
MTDQTADNGTQTPAFDTAAEAAAIWQELEQNSQDDTGTQAPAGDDDRLAGDLSTGDDTDPAPAAPVAGDDDIWKDAPPAAKEAYEKLQQEKKQLEHETRSHEGRVAARQNRIAELSRQLEQMKKPEPSGDDPLTQIASDFPELHAPLSKAIESVNSRAEQVEAAQRGRIETELKEEQRRYVEEVNAQTEALKQEHPDYLDVIKANVDKWTMWVEDQPKAIRDAVARNSDDITDAKAAAQVLSAFKAFLNPPATAPQPSPQSDKRQRQIGATASPGTGNRQPVVTGIPEDGDPQAIWDAFEKEEARKQR